MNRKQKSKRQLTKLIQEDIITVTSGGVTALQISLDEVKIDKVEHFRSVLYFNLRINNKLRNWPAVFHEDITEEEENQNTQ